MLKRLKFCLPVLSSLILLLPAHAPSAEDEPLDCVGCHVDVESKSTAHEGVGCPECHSNITSEEDHPETALVELSGNAICAQCHPLSDEALGAGVHQGQVSCEECHGASHEIPLNGDLSSPVSPFNQIVTCGACHEDGEGLIESYKDSVHGRGLLRSGLIDAASCSDCHGDHAILAITDPRSPTAHQNSPQMCGECHVGLLDRWLSLSAHGQAWLEDKTSDPVCTTCHQTHEIADPTRGGARQGMPDQCGDCHGELYSSYRLTFHGKSTHLGMLSGAICSDCHTPHENLPADDPRSSINPDNLGDTCGACHVGVPAAFHEIDMHNDPTDPADNAYVYWIYIGMMALLIGVFAFFGLHDLLWLQRALVGTLRGEYHPLRARSQQDQYVRRFRGLYVVLHIVIIITFLLLAMTGLPLKFDHAPWAQTMMNLLGGVETARVMHRIAAIGTFGYMLIHLVHLGFRAIVKRERGLFWGPNSMVPQWRDITDLAGNIRYFLYLGPRPAGDRWGYWEKFDYLAVFWGVMIIGLSGLMLWFPAFFTQYLPGWAINAALVVHSDEALLATGFIFVFHFFHTHLRPESFPMDPVVFTGRMPLEKFREERPREYERMLEEGTLEAHLSDPPTREELAWSYAFGFIALTVGLILAGAIFWALLSH